MLRLQLIIELLNPLGRGGRAGVLASLGGRYRLRAISFFLRPEPVEERLDSGGIGVCRGFAASCGPDECDRNRYLPGN